MADLLGGRRSLRGG